MKNADIVAFLGEPNRKYGGGTTPICISYDKLGYEFTFVYPIWDVADNPLNFIGIFAKDTDKQKSMCNLCRKNSSLVCG